jgi:hypothetical protein
MPSHAALLDLDRRIQLRPAITRAFWSKRCAWPGDHLFLHVEARHIPDGTPLSIALVEDDTDEGNPDDALGPMAGNHVIEGGKWCSEYVLDLSEAALGTALEVEGDTYEFCFDVTIARYGLCRRSTRLYVPIEPFIPSH